MPILKFREADLAREYGIMCQRLFPRPDLPTPFGATYCEVAVGEATAPHQHYDGETFYIARGEGEIRIEGETAKAVRPGDVVYLPAHARHELVNTGDTVLTFFSVWWDDATAGTLPTRRLIIAAPPTPNGALHLGHLSGPYVAADVHARYMRMRRVTTATLCGSDDFQSYTAVAAGRAGDTPTALAGRFGDGNQATLRAIDAHPDLYMRPSRDAAYVAEVQAFFTVLAEKGAIVAQDAPVLWCTPCDRYLYEAHVAGTCPHCGAGTSGNGCEGCYRPNDCVDLVEPRCGHCGTNATVVTRRRWVFPLAAHREMLAQFHADCAMSPHLRDYAANLLASGLPDIAVSHVADWGIGVPDEPGLVIYEWFEMAAGFLFGARQLAADGTWESWWKSPEADVVQFFGFDNAFFFVTFLPAVMRAYDGEIRLPVALSTNEFYRLDGLKFSTSRRHAIWGDQALEWLGSDVVRYALAWDRPEHEQTSFTVAGAQSIVVRDLVHGVDDWLLDVGNRLKTHFNDFVPPAGPMTPVQAAFQARLQEHAAKAAAALAIADFSTRRLARGLAALVEDAREFRRAHAHRQPSGLPTEPDAAMALEMAAVRLYGLLAYPLMPALSARLLAALGENVEGGPRWDAQAALLPAGRRVRSWPVGELSAAALGLEALASALRPTPA